MRDTSPDRLGGEITIRLAHADEIAEIQRLAQLETRAATAGPHLLGIRDGIVVAAISCSTHEILANPFEATLDIQALLVLRVRHLPGSGSRRLVSRRRQRRPVLAPT